MSSSEESIRSKYDAQSVTTLIRLRDEAAVSGLDLEILNEALADRGVSDESIDRLCDHARALADHMAASLESLDRLWIGIERGDQGSFRGRIRGAWLKIVADLQSHTFSLDGAYLGEIVQLLTPSMAHHSYPPFEDMGMNGSWAEFVEEMTPEYPIEEAWVLAQLCWGQHVRDCSLTLGWLVANGCRVQFRKYALFPLVERHIELINRLHDAGPGNWDAEGLRALFSRLEAEQLTDAA